MKVRVKRYSKEGNKETINILEKIKKTDKTEKEAILEFYKSYLEAAIKQKELFESLQKVGGDFKKSKKTINIEKLQKNADYLKQFNLKNDSKNELIIDFAKKDKNNMPPTTLLSEPFLGLMKGKYQELEEEIQNFGNSGLDFLGYWSCSLIYSSALLVMRQSPCAAKIKLLRRDQDTITEATEFKLFLQLLEDMGQKVPKFEITYEGN